VGKCIKKLIHASIQVIFFKKLAKMMSEWFIHCANRGNRISD